VRRISFLGVIVIACLSIPLFVWQTNHKQQSQSHAAALQSATSLSGMHVSGNKLVNLNGETIILRGVNRSGIEYSCLSSGFSDGPTDIASLQAIQSWNANVIRIPLNEDCWLNINGVTLGGAAYKQDVINYVNSITSLGIAAILDLHWSAPGTFKAGGQEPMADQDHSPAFWQDVASMFKNNSLVLFDLYNEPDPIPFSSTYPGGFSAWQTADFACVRDGCQATATQGVQYQTAGMQELVNTVRNTGATNVVMIGGIQEAGTITQYVGNSSTTPSGYMPTDTLNNIVVSQHLYNNAACSSLSCWNNTIAPVALHYPIITGEFGDTDCTTTYSSQVLPWLDTNEISYLAWTWDTWNSCQALITDYTGTPKSPYGQFYHDYLANVSQPTPTTVPTLPATPTPTGTQKLGGLNLDGYCASLNQGTTAALVNNQWVCQQTGIAINMTSACQWEYPSQNAFAQQDTPGDQFSWSCYSSTGSPSTTPTLTPTTAPTPTLTPTPVTTKLALIIGLDGIGKAGDNVSRTSTGNLNPLHPQRNVTLILSDQNNTPLPAITGQVSYDSVSGLFKGAIALPSTVTSGFYTLKASTPSFLLKAIPGILTVTIGQTTTVPTTDLTAGDINNDNQISLLDYNQILSCFGSSTSTCTPSDLDDDGTVGGSDYNLFLRELSVQNGG